MKNKTWIVCAIGLLVISAALAAPVQNNIYSFSFSGGASPLGSLISDSKGNLYGTTSNGGANYGGEVFELSPSHGGWAFNILYSFNPADGDGFLPYSGLVFDSQGNLYGTTEAGSMAQGLSMSCRFPMAVGQRPDCIPSIRETATEDSQLRR